MAVGIRYKPFQYQESYIPMDLVPMVDQTLGYHQNRYDQTNQAIASMYNDLYNRQIYDQDAFNNEVNAIKGRINDIDNKYNKDLSAGMSDYVQLIGKAKQSPFWKLNDYANKELERQQTIEDQLRAQGKNVLGFKRLDNKLTTVDPNTGKARYLRPDEINFDVQQQLDYTDTQGKLWDKALHEERTAGKLPDVLDPSKPWVQILNTAGINDKQVKKKIGYIYEQYKDTDEYKQQKRKLIELDYKDLPKEEAEKIAEAHIMKDIIDTGKSREYNSSMWQNEHNPDYDKNSTKPQTAFNFSGTYRVNAEESIEAKKKFYDSIEKNFTPTGEYKSPVEQAQLASEEKRKKALEWLQNNPGKSYSDSPYSYGSEEHFLKRNQGKNNQFTQDDVTKEYLDFKNQYKQAFKEGKDRGLTEQQIFQKLKENDLNKTKFETLSWQHSDLESQKAINNRLQMYFDRPGSRDSKYSVLDENLNKKDEVKGSDLGDIVSTDINLMKGKLNVTTKTGKDKFQSIEFNENVLPEDTQNYLTVAKEVLNNSFDLSDKSFQPVVDKYAPKEYYNGRYYNRGYMKSPSDGLIYEVLTDESKKPVASMGQGFSPEQFGELSKVKVYTSLNPYYNKKAPK